MLRLYSSMLTPAQVRSPLAQIKAAATHVWRLSKTEVASMRLESDFRGRNTRNMAFNQGRMVVQTSPWNGNGQTGLGEADWR